jgi:F-type H+-transporting ATPase subunit gamma
MTQKPSVAQLLPLPAEDDGDMQHHWDYIYEPEARDLLDGLLTRYIESQVYRRWWKTRPVSRRRACWR